MSPEFTGALTAPYRSANTAAALAAREFGQPSRQIIESGLCGVDRVYALAGGDVAELMGAARRILTEMLAGRQELLDELRGEEPEASRK